MKTVEQRLAHNIASRKSYYKRCQDPIYKAELARRQRERYVQSKLTEEGREKNRAYWRKRYHVNIKCDPKQLHRKRELTLAAVNRRRSIQQEKRKLLQALIGSKCVSCGLTDYRLLDFDHTDPLTKTMNISQKLHLSFEVLTEEVKKCQLLCPNCHRLKTMEDKQFDARIRKFRNPKKNSSF